MEILWIEEAESTNSYLKEKAGEIAPMTMVCARRQTAGRGQRGNSWESEPGKNLTFSFLTGDLPIRASQQFAASEAAALAVVAALEDFGIKAKVKWPNDIYVGDGKISGILIENSILGSSISRCIVGVGLNVNQTVFLSEAPNPVSMADIARREFELDFVAVSLAAHFERFFGMLVSPESLHREYLERLWRHDGVDYPYREVSTGEHFLASIADVEPGGRLVLRSAGTERKYSFKEIEFLKVQE